VRDEGLTIVATGQHVRRLLRLATRAYLLDEGQVILSGTGEELLASEQLRRILLP
jgi:ABC-type lipopolysaccharide export system ATPase subunit